MKAQGLADNNTIKPEIFVVSIGDVADIAAQKLVYDLRLLGIRAERDLCSRSVKAQMKYANKLGAGFSIVLGDDEISRNSVDIKNMETGESCPIAVEADKIAEYIRK